MARRSLRPHLNQIRSWVRQGRTDAWIAHQLEVTVQQIQSFKREQDLEPDGDNGAEAPAAGTDFDDEIDLRAEDDALIAAELEAEEAKRQEEAAAAAAAEAEAAANGDGDASDDADADPDAEGDAKPRRRRSRRGGRSRRAGGSTGALEGSFDHGEEGYGLWLDPAVADNPVYAEHWAGHRPVEVTIEEDQIVIRRSGAADDDA
jgi:hypothetical protein